VYMQQQAMPFPQQQMQQQQMQQQQMQQQQMPYQQPYQQPYPQPYQQPQQAYQQPAPYQVAQPQVVVAPSLVRSSRPRWEKDRSNCALCNVGMGSGSRHHCRSCGRSVCDPCSKTRLYLRHLGYGSPERTCRVCVAELQKPLVPQQQAPPPAQSPQFQSPTPPAYPNASAPPL
jgi:hypothetical protein